MRPLELDRGEERFFFGGKRREKKLRAQRAITAVCEGSETGMQWNNSRMMRIILCWASNRWHFIWGLLHASYLTRLAESMSSERTECAISRLIVFSIWWNLSFASNNVIGSALPSSLGISIYFYDNSSQTNANESESWHNTIPHLHNLPYRRIMYHYWECTMNHCYLSDCLSHFLQELCALELLLHSSDAVDNTTYHRITHLSLPLAIISRFAQLCWCQLRPHQCNIILSSSFIPKPVDVTLIGLLSFRILLRGM